MSKQALKRVRRHLKLEVNREPLPEFAWPGGYPLLYVFTDGGCMCPDCANENITEIDDAIRSEHGNRPPTATGVVWAVAGVDAHMEGEPETCDHCGEQIESAYGPVE